MPGLDSELTVIYVDPMTTAIPRDTIPRLHRIVAHARDQLRGLADGDATFEGCRVRYGNTQRRLAQEGQGRFTAPPTGVSENERHWAPTRDCLAELMRWGAVASKPLPSSRVFVDRYRGEVYELTDRGIYLANLTTSGARFVDALSERLIAAHPYLGMLLLALEENPIRCPAISEGDVERGRAGIRGWATWAAERIGGETSPDLVAKEIAAHLDRRFGNPPPRRPSNKELAETTNDALMVAAFAASNVRLDATTIKALLRWGSELFLYDHSRYIPTSPDVNVIWLAADLNRGPDEVLIPARRGMAEHGDHVAQAFPRVYREQALASGSSLDEPYLPVHQLRAQVAHDCAVTRVLCDLVLARLADGGFPEVDVEVLLHIGTTGLPSSEPAFRHHGRRRMEATMRSRHRRSR